MLTALKFDLTHLRGDIYGGLTAGVVAIPLALAFGVASGLGPMAGMYGAIIVGFFAAWFGGTPTNVSGPTGPMVVVLAGLFASLSGDVGLILTAVVLAGLFQIAFGVARIGDFIRLVPYPVVSGFMSGIGVIIIILQLDATVGHMAPAGTIPALLYLPTAFLDINFSAFTVAAVTLLVVYTWPTAWGKYLPSALAALIVGTVLSLFVGELPILGDIPSGLPEFHMPVFEQSVMFLVVEAAFILAILGSIDSLLTSLVADNMTRTRHDSNQELIGQGIGNIASGLFGGLPGAGATMGTVVNIQAGAQTALSGLIRVLVLIIVIIGIADLTAMIPLAVLSGIALSVGLNIIDWGFLKRAHRVSPKSAAIMYAVIGLTVFVDLIIAVSIGVFVANLLTIDRLTKVQSDSVKAIRDGDEDELTRGEQTILNDANGKILVFSLGGPLFFGLAKAISRQRAVLSDHEVLFLDFTDVPVIGVSSSLAMEQMVHDDLAAEKPVYLVGMVDSVQERMGRLGVLDHISVNHIFTDRQSCLEDASVYLKQKADT